jgi:hypothetical protein
VILFETFLCQKDKAELLASRLKERSLLESDVRVCHHEMRNIF